ncbi:elongation factor Tu, partial [Clostridium perfringens WAL-14572]
TVATGRVERGVLHVGDEVEVIGLTEERRKTSCNRNRNVQKVIR